MDWPVSVFLFTSPFFLLSLGHYGHTFEYRKISQIVWSARHFDEVTFAVSEKQKIGLIGRNGAGKSTLLRIIWGKKKPIPAGWFCTILLAWVMWSNTKKLIWSKPPWIIWKLNPASQLGNAPKSPANLKWNPITWTNHCRPFRWLSDAFEIVRHASQNPNLFLLDEPTNFLDVHTQILLEKFLQNYNGAFIIVSHDREFLKRTCEQTLEIEQVACFFIRDRLMNIWNTKRTTDLCQSYNKKIDREQKHLQEFVDRFRYKALRRARLKANSRR